MILSKCRHAKSAKEVFSILKTVSTDNVFNIFAPHSGSLLNHCSTIPFDFSDAEIVKSIRGSGLKIFGDKGCRPREEILDYCKNITGGFSKRGLNGYKIDDLILACAILYVFLR